jgi:hypothetical protein
MIARGRSAGGLTSAAAARPAMPTSPTVLNAPMAWSIAVESI